MARRKKRNNGQTSNGTASQKQSPPNDASSKIQPETEELASNPPEVRHGDLPATTSRPPSARSRTSIDHSAAAAAILPRDLDGEMTVHNTEQPTSSEASGSGSAAVPSNNASDSDSGDESDDEDEEPTLRYNRIHSQAVEDLFQKDTCSCLTVSERYLVLGSHNGLVTIFSRPGFPRAAATAAGSASPSKGKGRAVEEKPTLVELEGDYVVKKYRAHTAGIMDIVIDEESQFIGTASMDGEPACFTCQSFVFIC